MKTDEFLKRDKSSMDSIEFLKRKQTPVDEETRMVVMQPLNEIRYKPVDVPSTNENPVEEYDAICEICQIKAITGTCKRCGLYQYHDRFDIMVRRKD